MVANSYCNIEKEETLDLLKLAFGNENLNKPTTFRWFSRFKNGMESVKDEKHVGRPILHRNPEKVSQISNLMKENPRIGLRDIEEETGISKSLVGSIIKEDLQLKNTPSKLVPKMLTIQQKENRVEV
ncbi:GVQW3 [Cordylochernes scorpioides]|uniref:GVQW3 n=1 Tax=Cordylochernes scorpioides TaxID=51811 RepID=A0ABY6LBY2_9ARAC|nr:GVQW3 [Cordylochernes scorpioides]